MKGSYKRNIFQHSPWEGNVEHIVFFSSNFLLLENISDFNNDTTSAHEKFGVNGFFENQSLIVFFFVAKMKTELICDVSNTKWYLIAQF